MTLVPISSDLPPPPPTGKCAICSAEGVGIHPPGMCLPCIDHVFDLKGGGRALRIGIPAVIAVMSEHREARLSWLPSGLRDSVVEKLPEPDRVAAALAWVPTRSTPFLLLRGATGRGKTRTLAIILLAYFRAAGRAPTIFWAGDLGAELALAWRNGTADSFINGLKACPMLAFDDLDKTKVTERVAEALFAVTDHRVREGLPMIITTNLDGAAWEQLLPAEYGPALVRRWRDYGVTVRP